MQRGTQIVLSLRRMNRIRGVDAANYSLIAEAGCTLAAVQAAAEARSDCFPLSLGSEGSCQIGGNLATNAGGTAVLRYGMMRDLTLGIEVVLADGSVISTLCAAAQGQHRLRPQGPADRQRRHAGRDHRGLPEVVPAAAQRRHGVDRVPDPRAAIAARAAARGQRRPAGELRAGAAVRPRPGAGAMCRVRATRVPPHAPWYVLVELTSSGHDDLDALLEQALAAAIEAARRARCGHRPHPANSARISGGCAKAFPKRSAAPAAASSTTSPCPWPRCRSSSSAARGLRRQLVPEGFLVAYGHVGDGNLHFNLNQRPGDGQRPRSCAREPALQRAIHDLVADMGGSFSAEHGIGQLKVGELERYAQPAELAAMRSIKRALDPNGILNPGKVLRSSAL